MMSASEMAVSPGGTPPPAMLDLTSASILRVEVGGALVPLLDPPETNRGFMELAEVTFVGPLGAKCSLRIDDAPLPESDSPNRWHWKPGFFAGEVRAELISEDERVLGTWRLDVSPDPKKLGRDLFHEMVIDLIEYDPSLVVGKEPARTRLGALGDQQDPLVALARLRGRDAALRKVLASIQVEPIRALRARRRRVPLHSVRRADHRTATAAIRQPAVLAALGAFESDGDDLEYLVEHDGGPSSALDQLRADVPDVERHLDSPANRCILAVINGLIRRTTDTLDRLAIQVERDRESETSTGLSDRWPIWRKSLQDIHAHFLRASRRSPFRDVRRAEITVAGLNAVSAHPLYARFWRLAWEAMKPGISGPEANELLPMNPTWQIYESWCFVELGRHIKTWFPEFQWERVSSRELAGRAEDQSELRLLLQPEFRSTGGKPRTGFCSISRRRVPDLVLSWSREAEKRFFVLDAKWRVSHESVLDAMQSAHIYQDSLRWGDRRPEASLLLVPRGGGAEWLETFGSVAEHRVGIATLAPGASPPGWLREVLKVPSIGSPGAGPPSPAHGTEAS